MQNKRHHTEVVTSQIKAFKPAVNMSSAVGDSSYEFM